MKRELKSQKGASLVTTSLLVALIALVAIPSLNYLAFRVADTFCYGGEIVDTGYMITNTSEIFHIIKFNGSTCEQRVIGPNPNPPGNGDTSPGIDPNQELPL